MLRLAAAAMGSGPSKGATAGGERRLTGKAKTDAQRLLLEAAAPAPGSCTTEVSAVALPPLRRSCAFALEARMSERFVPTNSAHFLQECTTYI